MTAPVKPPAAPAPTYPDGFVMDNGTDAVPSGRVRVIGPNNEQGTIPIPGSAPALPGPGPMRRSVTFDPTPDPYAGMNSDQRSLANRDEIVRGVLRQGIPTAAALGATALAGPEAGWGLRMLLAGAGGTAGDLGGQAATGEPLSLPTAVTRGALESAGSGAGDLLAAGARGLAGGWYRGALRPGVAATNDAVETASRLTRSTVPPDVADLSKQGLKLRVPLGPGIGGRGVERIAALDAPSNAALSGALADATHQGQTFNMWGMQPAVNDLRAEVASQTNGPAAVRQIDAWLGELKNSKTWRLPGAKPGTLGAYRDVTPEELQGFKAKWQDEAASYYKQIAKGTADENTVLHQRFAAALAKSAQDALEAMPHPSAQFPGKTVGEVIADANSKLSSTYPLYGAVKNAEVAMAGTRGPGSPWWAHAGAPAAGAAGGALVGGPAGGAVGAGLGLAADKLMSNPAIASRLALAVTSTPAQMLMRMAPRAVPPLAGYAMADQTRH